MQQRAALALVGNRVYVAYGGLNGDCGDYHGHVVGARTDGTGGLSVYRVPTPREGGIWGTSGPAVTADRRLLVAVGNGASTSEFDGTDSVLALSTPQLRRVELFAPSTWRADNTADLDLGSMGPALLGDGHVVIAGKRGTVYLLRADALGGIGGAIDTAAGCSAYGGPAVAGDTVYLPCTAGVRAIRVTGDRLRPQWRADGIFGSPVVGGDAVWVVTSDGDLVALDRSTGAPIVRHRVGPVAHFATPTLWGSLVLVPTASGVTAVSVR
jgi:outer membrane protein assembly factor BamB